MAIFQKHCKFEHGYPIMREQVTDLEGVMVALPCVQRDMYRSGKPAVQLPVYYYNIKNILLVGLHRELDRGNKLSASSSNTV